MSDYNILDASGDMNRVNEFLIKEYNYDLYDFSHSIAIVLSAKPLIKFWDIWLIKKGNIPNQKIVVREIKRLKKIEKRLLRELDAHQLAMQNIKNPLLSKAIMPGSENWRDKEAKTREFWLKKTYRIGETIGSEIDRLKGFLNVFKRTKGKPPQPRYIIASLWSLVMKDSEEPHLENIDALINWFYENLKGASYRDELDISEHPPSSGNISRFMRNYRDVLEEDKKGIFFHNYKEFSDREKVFAFKIAFEKDNPKIYPLSPTSKDDISSLIMFPEKVKNESK